MEEDRIVVDFTALQQISKTLDNAGNELNSAASMLSAVSLTREGGAFQRISSRCPLKTVGGTVSASTVSQAVSSYRSAINRIGNYSIALATAVREAYGRFQNTENGLSGNGSTMYAIVNGTEFKPRTDFFGKREWNSYLFRLFSETADMYIIKSSVTDKRSLKGEWEPDALDKQIKRYLDDHGLRDKEPFGFKPETEYRDIHGKEINEKDAPTFYDREATVMEWKREVSYSNSIFDANYDFGRGGDLGIKVGTFSASAGVSAGLYVLSADGKGYRFSPGVKAEVGASYTAFEMEYKNQLLGDEMLGLNVGATATAGKVGAKASLNAQIFGEDGKLDAQLGVSAKAEAIAGELEGKAAMNFLGGEIGVKGSVNYGIGAHADIGFRDGVFKFDVGATLGVGVSVGAEIDVGGMVNTAVDAASAAWDGIQQGWNEFLSWW